jgi:hypothetical protein
LKKGRVDNDVYVQTVISNLQKNEFDFNNKEHTNIGDIVLSNIEGNPIVPFPTFTADLIMYECEKYDKNKGKDLI